MSILSKEEVKDQISIGARDFFFDSMELAKKHSEHPADVLLIMAKKLTILQVTMFSFMAVIRKEDSVATFYKDMHEMATDGLNLIVDNPEILLKFNSITPKEIGPNGVEGIVKLLQEMKTFKREVT